jgi:hypothetical protein
MGSLVERAERTRHAEMLREYRRKPVTTPEDTTTATPPPPPPTSEGPTPTGRFIAQQGRDEWITEMLRKTNGTLSYREMQERYKTAHGGVGVSNDVFTKLREKLGFPPLGKKKGGWPKGKKRAGHVPVHSRRRKGKKAAVEEPVPVPALRDVSTEELMAELERRESEASELLKRLGKLAGRKRREEDEDEP